MKRYYDMLVFDKAAEDVLKHLGWSGACVVGGVESVGQGFELLKGAVVSGDVLKSARNSLSDYDLVYAEVSSFDANRAASECLELDAIVISEGYVREHRAGRKLPLDYVCLKNMSEQGIALIFPLKVLIDCLGYFRANALDCLRRTLFLARKAKVKVILASGARNLSELRSPCDLLFFGGIIGLPENEVEKAVSENSRALIEKASDRNNPNVILSGLTVVEWGEQKRASEKKKYGWY
jgi:RNase P/RNase MRP subunit p30